MVVYDKIIRLTIPLEYNYLLLVVLDNVEKTPKIIDTIKKVLNSN